MSFCDMYIFRQNEIWFMASFIFLLGCVWEEGKIRGKKMKRKIKFVCLGKWEEEKIKSDIFSESYHFYKFQDRFLSLIFFSPKYPVLCHFF